jgi:hypothetical protein
MSINTHCPILLQKNKHNEQQSHIHVILKNLGNQPGKTPKWGNPKRERDFISFRKDVSTMRLHLNPKQNHLHHPSFPSKNIS